MRGRIALACLLLAFAPAARAQSCDLLRHAEIPLRYDPIRGGLLVDAKVRGEKVPMVVATGAPMTSLSRGTVDLLKLEPRYDSRHRARGPSAGDVRFLKVTTPDFSLGNRELGERELFVTEGTSDGDIATIGRLGLDFLYDYDVEFDSKAARLSLFTPVACATSAPRGGEAESARLWSTARGQRVLFDVYIDGRKMRAELDSGEPRTYVTRPAARRLGLALDATDTQPGPALLGIDGKLRPTLLHQFESFAIEGEEIRNPRLPIVEFLSRPGEPKRDGVEVVVGADWVNAHHVYIARAARLLHFDYLGGPVFGK